MNLISRGRTEMIVSLKKMAMRGIVATKPSYVTLGIVRWGLEFGWLTLTPSGEYVRVNGSVEERLDFWSVRRAIAKASKARRFNE